MTKLNALPAKYGLMVRAIKMLHTVLMCVTKLLGHLFFVFIIEIEITVGKLSVLFDYLVENVDIQGKSLRAIQLFDKLSANWATHSILVVKF